MRAALRLAERLRRRAAGEDGSDDGVTAIEAAIVIPVLLLLVIGILEFGLVFKDQVGITSAVRAGARIASAEPRMSTFATDAAAQVSSAASGVDLSSTDQLWVYRANSSGHPESAGTDFSSCTTACVQFTWNTSTKAFVKTSDNWPATSQNACQGTQDRVGVYLKMTHRSATNAIFSTLGLNTWTVMRFEPVPILQGGGCSS